MSWTFIAENVTSQTVSGHQRTKLSCRGNGGEVTSRRSANERQAKFEQPSRIEGCEACSEVFGLW